jgi:hypothetical protein
LQSLGIDKEALEEKYLGLPTALGRNITGPFEKIWTRVRDFMGGWCEKNLGAPGREVLIKSIVQAIPSFAMSCFALSKTTCKKIAAAEASFWWGGNSQARRMHWRNWPALTQPKCHGGMGFRDLQLFNTAMLGKQGWRLISNPDSLCARVLKGKYYHGEDFMRARKKKNCSHTWRAILRGRSALELGLIKRIGNGSSTNIWLDRWIPGVPGLKPMCMKPGATASSVAELIEVESGAWDDDALHANLLLPDALAVKRIPRGFWMRTLGPGVKRKMVYTRSALLIGFLPPLIELSRSMKVISPVPLLARRIQFGRSSGNLLSHLKSSASGGGC